MKRAMRYAVRDLLDITNIGGCIVTWDALNTQKDTVKAVIAKKGGYVWALKGNQQSFYEDVSLYFDDTTLKTLEGNAQTYLKTVDKEQSGVATREYYLTQDIGWLSQKKEWAGLKSIGCVIRTLKNKLHWHLDYTFRDDQNTTMRRHGAQNLQSMKRAALAILSRRVAILPQTAVY